MSRLLSSVALAVLLVAAVPALGGASSARVAANTQTFQDSTGENPGAPDIQNVTVSNDNAGTVTFTVNIPNQAGLSGEKLTVIELDTDNNPATGSPDEIDRGADYAIQLFLNQVDLFQWDGQNFSRSAAGPSEATLIFSNTANGPVIKINNSELANTKKFGFNVFTLSGLFIDPSGNIDDTNARGDIAPDLGHGLYTYEVKTTPLRLLARNFKLVPSRPRAGAQFGVRMSVVRNDTGAVLEGGTVKCVAKINGKSIAARTHKVANKLAQCAWVIPSSARGKRLTGSITVVFEGKKVTKTFSATIS